MLVRAKWNIKDAAGWHMTGEIFETEEELGDAVEVLFKPEEPPKEEPAQEPVKEPEKPRTARRKKSNG